MENLLQVGIISSTHGVRGEVKVYPTTSSLERFKMLKEVILDQTDVILHIESVKFFKQFAILKFKEYQSLNEVEAIKGKSLFVTRENAVALEENEYYIADLIDMQVEDDAHGLKGIISDVMETGANDVYVIQLSDKRELLLPAIEECVLSVDLEQNIMKINVLEGLL